MSSKGRIDIATVSYRCYPIRKPKGPVKPLEVIGLDTEAWATGHCFMIATSMGEVFSFNQWPSCMFTRKYRSSTFVAYNLKYDESALLQVLPLAQLQRLRVNGSVEYDGFTYESIPHKMLAIHKGKKRIVVYDMYNFYEGSLENNAIKYLGAAKLNLPTKRFFPNYVCEHWAEIARYCVRDAELVKGLADVILERFRSYGMQPRKLFSTAYISYQYFSTHTPYVTVKRFWDKYRELLQFAMDSYNGGKFEVTTKGPGEYWEYDLVSAYPSEIAALIDISWARVERGKNVKGNPVYGFIYVEGTIPRHVFSPVAFVHGTVNVYPVGRIKRCITLAEYQYLIAHGADLTITDGYWLKVDNRQFPYHREIHRLVNLKAQYKKSGQELDYHTVKILLNSLYGKMVQLLPKGEGWKASTCWNPIYGAIITANCRIKVSELQARFPSIVAVHTDSVVSTKPLPFGISAGLGELSFECAGAGVILGSGIYQIGDKVRFRGFDYRKSLTAMLDVDRSTLTLSDTRAFSWKEVAFHGWSEANINRFAEIPKKLCVNFDRKRVWLRDWSTFREALSRNVDSIPHSELSLGL